jgi:hypothetical protein
MKFYNRQHKYYCGVDLHAGKMDVCILDCKGKVVVHLNIKTDPERYFELVFPFIEDVVVSVECVFCWYWLADLCADHKIDFVLGHALYMKAIHGGKTKNDKIDSYKLAMLLKGGNFPTAYPYPAKWRATRDLLRRRFFPGAAANWWPISTTPMPSTTCRRSGKNCHEKTTMAVSPKGLKTRLSERASRSTWP